MDKIETHPVQLHYKPHQRPCAPVVLTLRAYEVYCALYHEQPAMVTGECRGGFGVSELLAFLYARSFPKSEWRQRVDEAFRGMEIG